MNLVYAAMSRQIIPVDQGGNGRDRSDWAYLGEFATIDEARRVLSTSRARGNETKILLRNPRQAGGEKVVEHTELQRIDHRADEYDVPA